MFFLLVLALALLAPDPARADPISVAILTAVGIEATATAVAVTTAILTTIVSIGLSFVSQLLSQKSKKGFNTNLDQGLTVTQREATAPRRIVYGLCRLGGTVVFMGTGPTKDQLQYVVALCEGPIESFEYWFLNDQRVFPRVSDGGVLDNPWTKDGNPYVALRGHLGDPAQAADGAMIVNFPGSWTSSHKLSGIAYFILSLYWDSTIFQQGVPNATVTVKGTQVYDPRTGLTAWSNNAALCIRDYLTRPYAKGGCGFSASEIDDTNFAAQANICDETITLASGGTQARYTINGVVQLGDDDTPQDRLNALLTACAGKLVYSGGKWKLFVGAWRPSGFTLTDDMMVGPVTVQTRISRKDQFNAVKGKYREKGVGRYIPTDFPAVTSATFEAEDGGERVYRDITLEYTTDAAAAQRLAKIELYRSREPMQVQVKCSLQAYPVAVGDVISVTHARWGWSAKPFEVVGWEWAAEDSGGAVALSIQLTLRETSSAVYDWSATDEQLLASEPATTLPEWRYVDPPTALAVTESLYQTSGSAGVKSQATLTWSVPDNPFIATYEAQYKLSSSSTWLALPATSGTSSVLPDVAPGTYDLRVRSVTALGARSDWATQSYEILGLKAAPSSPTSVRSTVSGGMVVLTWTRSPDLDVRIGGQTLIRHSPVTSAPTWDQTTSACEPLPGDATTTTLPVKTGYYLIRFKDSSGTLSPSYVSVSATQSSVAALVTLASVTEDPTFTGTKTNCAVASSTLTLTAGQLSGLYVFANSIDLGSVKNVRLTGWLKGYSSSANDLIDGRTALIDTWSDFDGSAGADADAWIEARLSNDNATWTAWARLDALECSTRYAQFRAQLTSADPSYTANISELRVKAEG